MHLLFAGIASVIGIACFIPYLRDIFRGTTKPHRYTWFVWAALQTVVAQAMWRSGAGIAVAPLVIGAVMCFFIFLLSLKYGSKAKGWGTKTFDLVCLAGALCAIAAYVFFHDALLSVVLATITDTLGFLPTLRKVYHEPHSETASTHLLSGTSNVFALAALASFSVTTVLYLATIMILDFLCGFLALRK
ncbi:MAG: hypothetical protein P4L67_00820 [Candidatus Pacebacteria bacterium]|nr:hypothetical protein [Candidatus Paceibacterota bacterium]